MEKVKVSLITGDGIGPEISEATRRIIDNSVARIDWEIVEAKPREGDCEAIFDRMLASINETSVGIKAPITTPIGSGYSSLTVALRKELNLYANVRPASKLPGIGPDFRTGELDLVTVRENTEGLYSGIEHEISGEYAESIKLTSVKGSERIAKFAFEYASREGRSKVTAVHKANILKKSDGLFLDSARKISRDYPGVELDEKIVDNMAMQLVLHPEDYEVLLAPNLYGDILSDLTAGLIGGLGVAPGGNFGDDIVLFEAVHGSAPDIAGKNVANPLGLVRSGLMMLEHVNQTDAADQIESAVNEVLRGGKVLTPDLGGNATTAELTEEIINHL